MGALPKWSRGDGRFTQRVKGYRPSGNSRPLRETQLYPSRAIDITPIKNSSGGNQSRFYYMRLRSFTFYRGKRRFFLRYISTFFNRQSVTVTLHNSLKKVNFPSRGIFGLQIPRFFVGVVKLRWCGRKSQKNEISGGAGICLFKQTPCGVLKRVWCV